MSVVGTEKFLILNGESLNAGLLWQAVEEKWPVSISESAEQKVKASRKYLEQRMQAGDVMYGVNTGFGAFSSVKIPADQIAELQLNIIRSHSVGLGPSFSKKECRAILILRANTLVRGHSAIRWETVQKICEHLNTDWIPEIPEQGSVGASGDLAPLSHLALALIGEGSFHPQEGTLAPSAQQPKPLQLQAKEGLSLINGCQVMTGVGILALKKMEECLMLADVAGALVLEAMHGSRKAFHPLLSKFRPHSGEVQTAENLRRILGESSEIGSSHENCNKVQDCYSLRCMPAIHGSVRNAKNFLKQTLEIESNSSTDNPLVFAEENEILSCGNFHGMPVAHALDMATLALTSLSSVSEQRVSKLMNPAMSELPAFLAPSGGLHSGFMILHVAAASLVSENKALSHPASVDSIPTSADKEDHVSMGTIAARKFRSVVENTQKVIALELIAAAQALEFSRPLKTSPFLEEVMALIRQEISFASVDRVFSKDVQKCLNLWPALAALAARSGVKA